MDGEIVRIERRWQWTPEEKAALMAEVEAGGGRVSVVTGRRGISKSLLYNWRSVWKAAALVARTAPAAGFVELGVIAYASGQSPAMAAGFREGFVEADGFRIHYMEAGAAPALVPPEPLGR